MKEYIFQIDDALYNKETGEAVFKPKFVNELVRCKDCKYVIPYESGGFNCLTCPNVDRDVDENWFCADGERREDEVN